MARNRNREPNVLESTTNFFQFVTRGAARGAGGQVYSPHASKEVMAAANASTGASGAEKSRL